MIWRALCVIMVLLIITLILTNRKENFHKIVEPEMHREIRTQKLEQIGSNIIEKYVVLSDTIHDSKINKLINKLTNIIVGKYTITDHDIINYVKEVSRTLITRLLDEQKIETIVKQYNPSMDNRLLLDVCRALLRHPMLSPMKKILIGQFIIYKSDSNEEIERIYKYIVDVSLDEQVEKKTRMNAVDMLMLSNNSKYIKVAKKCLESLRRLDDPVVIPMTRPRHHIPVVIPMTRPRYHHLVNNELPREDINLQQLLLTQFENNHKPKVERTIYEDGQNVHNNQVNQSVLAAAKELIDKYNTPGNKVNTMNTDHLSIGEKTQINASIHRINTDSSIFNHNITLYSVYQSLLSFINDHKDKDELNKRLSEELIEMSGMCATGILARLINTIQGFDNSQEIKVKIKLDDEVYAKVKHILEKIIQEHERVDDIIEDMASENKSLFIKIVSDESKKMLPILLDEYKDIATEDEVKILLIKSLNTYTKTDGKFKF